jgi:hypothetical protein
MWPEGNIERQPPQETEGGIIMSIELNRRDFLKIVFQTVPTVAVVSKMALWPGEALSRPASDPVYLSIDENGYIVDPGFDYCDLITPTFREHHSLDGLSNAELKANLDDNFYEIEHLVTDPDNWTIDEIQEWLDTNVELEHLGSREAMKYTEYGPGIGIYDRMSNAQAASLGLELVDGDHPGSSFVGVAYHGNIESLNEGLERLGLNLVIS